MLKDALEEAEGLIFSGQNFNNLRYAHKRRSSVNFFFGGGQDIFAGKYMHEKLTKFPNFT